MKRIYTHSTTTQDIRNRIAVEARIVRKLIRNGVTNGWEVCVDDGSDDELIRGTQNELMEGVFAVEEAHLYFRKSINCRMVRCCVWLVMGNDGFDVMADYSVHPAFEAEITGPVDAYVDSLIPS